MYVSINFFKLSFLKMCFSSYNKVKGLIFYFINYAFSFELFYSNLLSTFIPVLISNKVSISLSAVAYE